MKVKLTEAEAKRTREWFHSLQDVHPDFLKLEDYTLALKLYLLLSDRRIPHSVFDGAKASELADV